MLLTLLRKLCCSTVSRQAFSTDDLTGIHCSSNTDVHWRKLWTRPKQALRIFTVRWAAQSDELRTCLEMSREVDPPFASFSKWRQWMTMNRFPWWAWYDGSAHCHIALDLCLFLGLSEIFWPVSRFYEPPGTGKTTVASHLLLHKRGFNRIHFSDCDRLFASFCDKSFWIWFVQRHWLWSILGEWRSRVKVGHSCFDVLSHKKNLTIFLRS